LSYWLGQLTNFKKDTGLLLESIFVDVILRMAVNSLSSFVVSIVIEFSIYLFDSFHYIVVIECSADHPLFATPAVQWLLI
jgi:hypothetical protein